MEAIPSFFYFCVLCIYKNKHNGKRNMKKVVNVGIGGKGFVMDNDAYSKLDSYFEQFRSKVSMGADQTRNLMDDLEARIAEFFSERLSGFKDVVDVNLVDMAICQFGMPDGSQFVYDNSQFVYDSSKSGQNGSLARKLFRDSDNKAIGGVCSGLAHYLGLDIALVRVLFVVCFIMGTASFWVYVIMWIVVPLAVTPQQKCEMLGK